MVGRLGGCAGPVGTAKQLSGFKTQDLCVVRATTRLADSHRCNDIDYLADGRKSSLAEMNPRPSFVWFKGSVVGHLLCLVRVDGAASARAAPAIVPGQGPRILPRPSPERVSRQRASENIQSTRLQPRPAPLEPGWMPSASRRTLASRGHLTQHSRRQISLCVGQYNRKRKTRRGCDDDLAPLPDLTSRTPRRDGTRCGHEPTDEKPWRLQNTAMGTCG